MTKSSSAVRDLILVAVGVIIVLILSYFFDAFIIIVKYLQKHPEKVAYIDEVITGLLALSIGLAIFAWRRWAEVKKETAQRIKNQEELLRIAETKAETEKIICKELHCDIEELKKIERSVLSRHPKAGKQTK